MAHSKRPLALGFLLVALMAAHGFAAVFLAPQLTFHADLTVESDQDPRVAAALEHEHQFPSSEPLIFLVPRDGPLRQVVTSLETKGLPVRSVLSVWKPEQDQPLEAFLKANALYRRLFLNPSGDHWQVYVPTRDGGQNEVLLSRSVPQDFPGVVVGGPPWVRALLDSAMATNLAWLLPGSLVILLLVFGWLTRSPTVALRLTLLSCLPALGVLLLFPATSTAFNFTTILAPLLTLALSTTYTLHIHHHLQEHGPGWTELARNRGPAVFWSALISALGFSSLWLSPLPALRLLGTLLVAGLGLSLFWVLVALPLLARAWPPRPHVDPPLGVPRAKPWVRWVFAAILLAALPGVAFVTKALHWSDYLSVRSSEGAELARFEVLVPTWQEATLHLSWPEDEGWLAPERWKALGALMDDWRRENPRLNLWSVWDAFPESPGGSALAEAMELLPPQQDTGKMIDGRRSELVVRFTLPKGPFPFQAFETEARARFPGVTAGWSGPFYRQELGMDSFLTGELWGLAAFFGLTGTLIVLRLRSFKRGLLAMTPALAAAAVFVGLAGWFQWPISPATALVAAACIGQSTDDGLLWSLLPPTPSVRASLGESTILLTTALSVLVLSSFANITQAAVLVILSLFFSTSMVLWFLPWRSRP